MGWEGWETPCLKRTSPDNGWVGRWNFLFGMAIFQGRTVSFRVLLLFHVINIALFVWKLNLQQLQQAGFRAASQGCCIPRVFSILYWPCSQKSVKWGMTGMTPEDHSAMENAGGLDHKNALEFESAIHTTTTPIIIIIIIIIMILMFISNTNLLTCRFCASLSARKTSSCLIFRWKTTFNSA